MTNKEQSHGAVISKEQSTGAVIIRDMKKEDAKKVADLFRECFSLSWSEKAVEEMFEVPGYHNLVARSGEEICGYIGMKAVLDEADIVNVAVSSSMRRAGIGTKLLKALLKKAAEQKIKKIFLEVRQGNAAAISLYEHAGFMRCGVRKSYYTMPREDALMMTWTVGNSNSFQ